MDNRTFCIALLLSALLAASAHAQSGPLQARNMALGHYTRPAVAAPEAPSDTWAAAADVSWGNIWNFEVINDSFRYRVDGEWTVVSLDVARKMGNHAAVSLSVPMVSRNGGFADSMIEGTHDILGLGSARRDLFERNDAAVGFVNDEGQTNVIRNTSTGVGDVVLRAVFDVGGNDKREFRVDTGITIPTGDADELEGAGGPGAFVGLASSLRMGESRWWLHAGARAGYADADDVLGIEVRKEFFDGLLGLEYLQSERASCLLQSSVSSPWTRDDLEGFCEPVVTLTLGGRWRVRGLFQVEAGITENLIHYNSSADLAAHLRVSRGF